MKLKDKIKIEFYSGLMNSAINLSGARKPMTPEAEAAHPPLGRDLRYNESYYFNFFNRKKAIGGFTWIGKLHNQKIVNATQLLYVGQDESYVKFVTDEYPESSNEIKCGNMRYEILEPLKKIRIVSAGRALRLRSKDNVLDPEEALLKAGERDFVDIELDCVYTGCSPLHNSKNLYARGVATQMVNNKFGLRHLGDIRKIAAEHYEQAGTYSGTLKIGGKKISLDAVGHRDHSWGIRDWFAPESWVWLSVEFGEEIGLNLCRIVIGRVDMFFGYIIRDGVNYPLKDYKLETEFEFDGITQKNIRFSIEDTGGFRMDVSGKVINVIHLTKKENGKRVIVNEAMTEYSWAKRSALGIAEYLHKLT